MLSRRCFTKVAVALVSVAVVYGRAEAAPIPEAPTNSSPATQPPIQGTMAYEANGAELSEPMRPPKPDYPPEMDAPGVNHGGQQSQHEEYKIECTETTINAMNADIQLMQDGVAKSVATKEMQMVEEMMASKNVGACEAHMRHALEGKKIDDPDRRP